MTIGDKVEKYDYEKRHRNLDAKAKGIVKSEKFFPVFINNGKEEILKPLSKTKPFTTPFFAYSEVFWSNVVNKYFDNTTPIYRLAFCDNYSKNVEKYYNKGTIVPSIICNDEYLVSLYEYFSKNSEENFDITYYVNYCMTLYDYSSVFNSKLVKNNYNLGEKLALQVLLSILKADQNFHYENVNFIYQDDKLIKLAPMIDHEFSSMFLFLDNEEKHSYTIDNYIKSIVYEDDKELSIKEKILKELYITSTPIPDELELIINRYPNIVDSFLEGLDLFISDIEKEGISIVNNSYIEPFNSEEYKIGMALYKNHNEQAAEFLRNDIKNKNVDLERISDLVTKDTLLVAESLKTNIEKKKEKINDKKRW